MAQLSGRPVRWNMMKVGADLIVRAKGDNTKQ
jgi:hypothetical protein